MRLVLSNGEKEIFRLAESSMSLKDSIHFYLLILILPCEGQIEINIL